MFIVIDFSNIFFNISFFLVYLLICFKNIFFHFYIVIYNPAMIEFTRFKFWISKDFFYNFKCFFARNTNNTYTTAPTASTLMDSIDRLIEEANTDMVAAAKALDFVAAARHRDRMRELQALKEQHAETKR